MRDVDGAAHLSTLMTATHRRAVLADIRARLEAKAPVRLVSTSLIEAGVDLDFPLVLRAASRDNSLAQAAGRCNREGRLAGLGELLVFRSEHPAPPLVEDYAAKGREVLARYSENDPVPWRRYRHISPCSGEATGPEALDAASVGQGAPAQGILNAITRGGMACPFEDIERAFRLIDDNQRAVIIRDGAHGIGEPALAALRHASPNKAAMELQKFAVNVPQTLWRRLWSAGALEWWAEDRFGEQFATLSHSALYDDAAGLAVDESMASAHR